ncbi:hypothetical protein F4677DRAFT_133770 [Hypoxylon crocopeplum]|nr:hypothetical protein F4677DRAFT_133770 [Hypoxylon crocopeplum]
MANDLTAFDGFHLDGLQDDLLWAPFEMDLMEEDFSGVDLLAGDSDPRQFHVPSITAKAADEDVHSSGKGADTIIEQRPSSGNAPLDMNDPAVLSDYASLLLFANNPVAHQFDLQDCNSSRQATIQALAAKLDLLYSYDSSVGAIQLRKEGYRKGLEQPGATQTAVPPFKHGISSPSSQWNHEQFSGRLSNLSNANEPSPSLHGAVAMDIDTTTSRLNLGNLDPWGDVGDDALTTSQCPGLSEDEQDFTLTNSRLTPSSWIGLSRTLKEVGACWRCKILRKKCDPDQPCKACPRLGTNTSRWHTIGCKRGTLLDHMPRVSLCPNAVNTSSRIRLDGTTDATQRMPKIPRGDRVELCLRDASNRLDRVFASENDTYTKIVLEILCSPMAIITDTPLSLRRDVEGNAIHIAWGLVEITSARDVLNITSVEYTLDVIKAAATYEAEYGLSQAVPIAIGCFRNCIEILRLHDGGHLVPELHDDCEGSRCQIQLFQDLSSNIKSFTDELSKVIFRKENRLHERRWWLSAFYSIWIQSYVRRTIRFVKDESKVQLSQETKEACSNYLLLALELFDATSASFDPLMSPWSLEEEPVNIDLKLIKYYRLAQKVLLSEQWPCDIGSSIDYLRQLYHDGDTVPTTHSQGGVRSPLMSGLGNVGNSEGHGASSARPSIFQSPKPAQPGGIFSVPLRTRSGAKRRAGSPLQDVSFIRRNGSSSSMLDSRDTRSRGLSIASPGSPMSSGYSFAYGTSSSTRWNGSADSLAEMFKLYGSSPPSARDQFEYLSPSKGNRPSLHYKSSNESFLELPRKLKEPRKLKGSPSASGARDIRGSFLCECCPKKPKKFQTAEELSAHEAEKRYECNFCGNRFKSKNEADRHENSLHVRRHAWSCSNIISAGYANVFQESIIRPGVADTCGYCGEDFLRNGGDNFFKQANESDWDERLSHVRDAHKFGECNSTKQFYRADHFRQHLKHSHAAVSGRWTNGLESICMCGVPPSTCQTQYEKRKETNETENEKLDSTIYETFDSVYT